MYVYIIYIYNINVSATFPKNVCKIHLCRVLSQNGIKNRCKSDSTQFHNFEAIHYHFFIQQQDQLFKYQFLCQIKQF